MFEKNPRLTYWKVAPKSVERTALVRNPKALLSEQGTAVFLCGLGEAAMLIDFREEVVGGLEMKIRCEADAHIEILYEETPDAARLNCCPDCIPAQHQTE